MVVAACLLLTACEKIDDSGRIEIFAESMSGNNKVLINGAVGTWVDNDSININGTAVAVERHDGHAYIRYATPLEVNRAYYPASLKVLSQSGDNVTFELPRVYHYRANSDGQLLELPMAARSEGSNPMEFRHLTGALCIMVKNTASVPLTLQSVSVSSNKYRLSGSCSVDFTSLQSINTVSNVPTSERHVSIVFDTGYTIAANTTLQVMIPILPVGNDHRFTVNVRAYRSGTNTAFLFNKTQPRFDNNSLERNELGFVPANIDGTTTGTVLEMVGSEYIVQSPLEFSIMTQAINNQWIPNSGNFVLLSDIDMTGVPITTINNNAYTGAINGDNHTVSNLTINGIDLGSSGSYCALFKEINATVKIKNITFNNLTLKYQGNTDFSLNLGGLAAYYSRSSTATLTVSNCTINISDIGIGGAHSAILFGGLLGEANGSGAHVNFSNCHVTTPNMSISGNTSIWWGGLIGNTGASIATFTNCSWSGSVTLNATNNIWIGGLIGRKTSNDFIATNCSVDGNVCVTAGGTSKYLGNLIGLYYTEGTTNLTGTTSNITFSLGGTTLNNVENYGINRP